MRREESTGTNTVAPTPPPMPKPKPKANSTGAMYGPPAPNTMTPPAWLGRGVVRPLIAPQAGVPALQYPRPAWNPQPQMYGPPAPQIAPDWTSWDTRQRLSPMERTPAFQYGNTLRPAWLQSEMYPPAPLWPSTEYQNPKLTHSRPKGSGYGSVMPKPNTMSTSGGGSGGGGGGGGGWGGGGGGGYYGGYQNNYPAYPIDMGLFQWNYRG